MRLGVYFNIFNAVEFLKPALLNVRPFADYIVGVYSLISNMGNPIAPFVIPLLRSLQKEGLIDRLICFELRATAKPNMMQVNNWQKYKMGRQACLEVGCTHLMLKDCDEFFDPKQFESMLPLFEKEDLVIAPIFEYFETPLKRAENISGLHVPVTYKAQYEYKKLKFPVTVDVTRAIDTAGKFIILTPGDLVMHHFTCVRYNERELKGKAEGHGHLMRLFGGDVQKYKKSIKDIMDTNQLRKVGDQFGIIRYWKEEFVDIYGEPSGKIGI